MDPFQIYYGGGEEAGWRKMLAAAGAPMQVSFKNLVRRLPKNKPYLIRERFPENSRVFLDSGAYSFNTQKGAPPSNDELTAFARRYEEFVTANLDDIEMVSEFDSNALGDKWIKGRRLAFYDALPPEKFMPIWHPEDGVDALRATGARYDIVGVTATDIDGRSLQQPLNLLARSGVHLHGVAMTKPDDLKRINFTSCASMSWLSPQRYGDTIIWDGRQLHRYPKAYKERARSQHAQWLDKQGFDVDAIKADNPQEVVRLSLWSWMQFAASVSAGRRTYEPSVGFSDAPEPLNTVITGEVVEAGFAQVEGSETVTTPLRALNSGQSETLPAPRSADVIQRTERRMLPGLSFSTITRQTTDEDGVVTEHSEQVLAPSQGVVRTCDNCYLSEQCPSYVAHHECGLDIPIEVRTPEQAAALRQGLIEMMAQRVAFQRFNEELNGGMPDPNLSSELDRLWKHMSIKAEIEDDRTSIDFSLKAKGNASTLERIFGREAPPMGLPNAPGMGPGEVDRYALSAIEGEVVRP